MRLASTVEPTPPLAQCRRELRDGLLNEGLKLGEGFNRNGKPYSWIIDCREVLLAPPYLQHAGRLLWERLRPYRPEAVGGMTMSADPLTIGVLYAAWAEDYPLRGFTIRQEAKSHGLRKQVEGPSIRPGARVALLDDVVNSGRTLKLSLEALAPLGARVVVVGTVIDYEHAAGEWLRGAGLPLEAIFTLAELGMEKRPPRDEGAATLRWTWEPLNKGEYTAPKSAPCISGATIFVGSDRGFLVALSLDGRERWRYAVRDEERGIHASPLVHAGRVYVGAYDGYVYCLDAADGALLWETRPGQWVGSSPAVDPASNRIYIGIEYGRAGGSLIALDADTGTLAWELKAAQYMHSSPWFDAPRRQVVVGANDGILYAADADTGAERWRFATGGEIKGKPAVDEDGICFVGSFDGFLYALDAATGRLLWRRRLARRLYTNPLLYRDLVIAGSHAARVVALERRSGRLRWVATTGGPVIGGAALVAGNAIAIGSADGCVYLLDGRTGDVLWQYRTGGPIRTTPGVGEGLFAVPSCDGKLYAFSARAE